MITLVSSFTDYMHVESTIIIISCEYNYVYMDNRIFCNLTKITKIAILRRI